MHHKDLEKTTTLAKQCAGTTGQMQSLHRFLPYSKFCMAGKDILWSTIGRATMSHDKTILCPSPNFDCLVLTKHQQVLIQHYCYEQPGSTCLWGRDQWWAMTGSRWVPQLLPLSPSHHKDKRWHSQREVSSFCITLTMLLCSDFLTDMMMITYIPSCFPESRITLIALSQKKFQQPGLSLDHI